MVDLSKRRFGRLTVLGDSGERGKHRQRYWLCRCYCGSIVTIRSDHLTSGRVSSCGCWRKKAASKNNTRHGHSRPGGITPTYVTWTSMKTRCLNPNCRAYRNYGGRGITVCVRWMEFENFLADMGERPDGLTLDRINNDGNYESDNCRWATWREQANNKKRQINLFEEV